MIARAIRELGLTGRPVNLHSSLSSFGHVDGGAHGVIEAFLSEGCTLLVPTFTHWYLMAPAEGRERERNGGPFVQPNWSEFPGYPPDAATRGYSPDLTECDLGLGIIPRTIAATPGRVRSGNPLNSFCAIGVLAAELCDPSAVVDPYDPFKRLIALDGAVVLAGCGLNRMTLIHESERMSGRRLLRRWARVGDEVVEVEVGKCSRGFEKLRPTLDDCIRQALVMESTWLVMDARVVAERAAEAIRSDPTLSSCGNPDCAGCRDSEAGGPIIPEA